MKPSLLKLLNQGFLLVKLKPSLLKLLNQGFLLVKLKSSLLKLLKQGFLLVKLKPSLLKLLKQRFLLVKLKPSLLKLLKQGFLLVKLKPSLRKFYGRHYDLVKNSLKIPKGGNHNPYIEEGQTTQRPKEKVQKYKQRSTKHTYKTKDRVTRTSPKTGGELRCSGRVGSSCSTSATRRVNLVTNPVISREWGKDREVFMTSGTYPWSFVTQIFHNAQPSHGGDRYGTSVYQMTTDMFIYKI